MRVEARAVLLAPPGDVWKLLAEPYHLTDWWPEYQGVEPDRRGRAPGAHWRVVRGPTGVATGGLLRRPGAPGTLVIGEVVEGRVIAWHDVEQGVDVRATLEPAAGRPHGSPACARDFGLARLPRGAAAGAASRGPPPLRPLPDGGRALTPAPSGWLKS